MRGNSRMNREQQVKVVIRLKPENNQNKFNKCVYLSEKEENQLVVETDSKKEIFMFDHIAHQATNQQELFSMIGQECVDSAFDGYNCCIFAYGQTGAGKTYSVLGALPDLVEDPYAPSRGILPRVLEQLFTSNSILSQNPNDQEAHIITCSYLQIYNEQIFDLLSSDKRIHQIREDAKKGVFVQGLLQKEMTSYRQALGMLLEGEKTRKMATTLMNTESSRSHAIFTIRVRTQIVEQEVTRVKHSKLHIVDLAGSERVKHTNVEGERLREGCNINRSLHVLGNVINSLVESSKKKKHIPYRDSKLTHYLKDSLGGNSITKLLANIHTNKFYFGDTLSTLMFAKRAKILKTKVELNETAVDNFDALRKQVRRLREELAQARYFKTDGRFSERDSLQGQLEWSYEKVPSDHNETDTSPQRMDMIKVLQQNETHLKALIEIYEEHMKTCLTSSNLQRKQNINIVKQWKNLEKRNISLTHLVKQIPSFSKIYKENLLLRQERYRAVQGLKSDEEVIKSKEQVLEKVTEIKTSHAEGQKIVDFYEKMIEQMQEKFRSCLDHLEKNYHQLQSECKAKDKKIKDLKKRKEYPPDIEELKNQNQYLNLSILQLQNQISKLQESEQKLSIQLKEAKKGTVRKERHDLRQSQVEENQEINAIYDKLVQIKKEAEREAQQHEHQRKQMHQTIQTLQSEINRFLDENRRLRVKYSKSRSRNHRSRERNDLDHSTPTSTIYKNNRRSDPVDRQDAFLSVKNISTHSQQPLQDSAVKELLTLKMDVKRKQKQINDLKKDVNQFMSCDRKIEEQFGKPLEEIITEYRQTVQRRCLTHSKSQNILQKWKDPEPWSINSKFEYKEEGETQWDNGGHVKRQAGRTSKRALNSPTH